PETVAHPTSWEMRTTLPPIRRPMRATHLPNKAAMQMDPAAAPATRVLAARLEPGARTRAALVEAVGEPQIRASLPTHRPMSAWARVDRAPMEAPKAHRMPRPK